MHLKSVLAFDMSADLRTILDSVPARPAVFGLFPHGNAAQVSAPYLGRTVDLRRRLGRLLAEPRAASKMLNLRDFTRRIEYQCVGSGFEATWLIYRLNRFYFSKQYRHRLRLKPPALLKVNLRNRFPRCYPTRRLANDGALYFGPFPSRLAAERFAAEFLDLFRIRRCVEDLIPDPSHPGCIYSQMRMCLAPCFGGCTDDEYQQEVSRVVAFLDADGQPVIHALEGERARASEALQFEEAARLHRRLAKAQEVLRMKPGMVRNLRELHAVIVARGAEPNTVVFFRVLGGELRGPATLRLDENVASPVSLDGRIHTLLESLTLPPDRPENGERESTTRAPAPSALPPWEHLSLLARWYYSSFREGELVMLPPSGEVPHARLTRLCRKVLAV